MPTPPEITPSAIRSTVHFTRLTAAELHRKIEVACRTRPALNHCILISDEGGKTSIHHLYQTGEVTFRHQSLLSDYYVTIEYRSADFLFVRLLKRELSALLQLSEPIKGKLAEPSMFESLGKCLQYLPKLFPDDLVVTESAIESARQCDFDAYECVITYLALFVKIRPHLAGIISEPSITPSHIDDYQKVGLSKRVILHRGAKLGLSRFIKIEGQVSSQALHLYFAWDSKTQKHLIGWVEVAPQNFLS